MNYWNICFSPAGGTAKCSHMLLDGMTSGYKELDLCDPKLDYAKLNFTQDDIVVFAVPSYGGLVPELALKRLDCFHGSHTRCILLVVYGNRAYKDTIVQLQDKVTKNGFTVVAACAAIAEHSIAHKIAAGRPDASDIEKLQQFGKKIAEKIASNNITTPDIPGNRPYRAPSSFSMIPHVTSKCNKCGLCASKCPAESINKDDPTITDHSRCISCMRCITLCPNQSRVLNPVKLAACTAMLKSKAGTRKKPELFM